MNISKFFTQKNIMIFETISKKPSHVREVSEKLKISPATVTQFAKKYSKFIIKSKEKNRLMLSINRENPEVRLIRSLLNYNRLISTKSYKKLKKLGKIGVYGSFANGTDDEYSDIDLWIKTDKKSVEIAGLFRSLEKELNMKVNPSVLTDSKIRSLEKEDPEFYLRLRLNSVGDNIDD
ncbi:MAG: nucleotidyltransferase domain-containing protein [Nanobdellota archaeon]